MKNSVASEIHIGPENSESESHLNSGDESQQCRGAAKLATLRSEEGEAKIAAPLPQTKRKRPYSKPMVRVYGRVQTLTSAVSFGSPNTDGGSGAMNKTH